jgi:murein DD-endopeptidase MepM/ murein hydrolase activator NlpD
MLGNLVQKGALRLPEIGSVTQPIASAIGVIRTQRKHVLLASAAGVALAAIAFTGVGYVRHAHNISEAQRSASQVESANIDLQDELGRLRDQIAASNRDLATAQRRVVALTEEMHARAQAQPVAPPAEATPPAKGDSKVAQLSQQLHMAEAERATLAARLSRAEAELAEQQSKQGDLLNQLQRKLDQMSSDRDRLKARVDQLEKQSALRHAQQQTAAAAQAAPAPAPLVAGQPAPPAPAPLAATAPVSQAQGEPAQRMAGVLNAPQLTGVLVAPPAPAAAAQTAAAAPPAAAEPKVAVAHGAIEQFARVLASAGVDVRHLFSEFGVNRDAGGPFIPAPRGANAPETLSPEKLAALRAMVKTLPVSAPLAEYRISSPFGVRSDPENDRAGFHTGIDLTAPYDTPVFATAPGTVTFAGYRDDYGRIVEIDHGNGIATRYAHLHAFTVSVGQRVGAHQQVGYLGSSGRATGPHVHYEVVVNGEPQDPEKFFTLGRYVQPMTAPVAVRN